MNRSLFIIFSTVVLDAIGIGLIFPILPALLKDITHSGNAAMYIGILASVYAVMQFIFSPLLGALSDRIGRRPVLIISLAGASINYLFLAFSHSLIFLIIGRVIAGISNANMAVASAYIIDISPEHKRAKYFGLMNAMFGAGFIIGPNMKGGFNGGLVTEITVANAKNLQDKSRVSLKGNLIKQTGKNDYLFKDSTGEITVEIERKAWRGQSITPKDLVEITGEVDKSWNKVEIEVKQIKVLPPKK